MKTKIFGLAIVLSLATMLGACEGGTEPSGDATTTPAATTAPAEPTDSGATTEPTATPTTTP
jgi:PBP1b-binding outer membrane lipoprotein LpoB